MEGKWSNLSPFVSKLTCKTSNKHAWFHLKMYVFLFKVNNISLSLSPFLSLAHSPLFWRQAACKVVLMLSNYSILANYSWLLVEGHFLFTLVSRSFFSLKKHLAWYIALSWGERERDSTPKATQDVCVEQEVFDFRVVCLFRCSTGCHHRLGLCQVLFWRWRVKKDGGWLHHWKKRKKKFFETLMSSSQLLGNQDAHVDLVDTAGASPFNNMRKLFFFYLNFFFYY